jgi:hypothetical protein
MRAIQVLPPRYKPRATLNLSKQKGVLIGLGVGSLLLFVMSIRLMLFVLPMLRTDLQDAGFVLRSVPDLLMFLGGGLGLLVVMVVLHEAIHALAFWYYTGDRPALGYRGAYAYAAAPGWYLPRGQHMVVALLPLAAITIGGLLLILIVPPSAVLPLALLITANVGAAIGDLVMVGWLLTLPARALVEDTGDAITVYDVVTEAEMEPEGHRERAE